MLTRRGLIGTLLAAPVIIRPGILMPVKPPLITTGLTELLTEVLREQDARRQANLAAWAADFNFTQVTPPPEMDDTAAAF